MRLHTESQLREAPQTRIEFVNFSKEAGGRRVVKDLSLTISGGQDLLLAGPEGAGKTTLLNAIVGLTKPSQGDVFINGVSIHRQEILLQRRRIGFVPHPPVLYDQLTAREYLQFIGELYGLKEELPRRIPEFLERFSLSRLADRLICSYPPSARNRLALVSALFHRPDILILDEPGFLRDPPEAAAMRALLAGFKEGGGLGLVSAPALQLSELPAERLAILHEGRLRFEGTPAQLRRKFQAGGELPLQEIYQRLIRPDALFR